MSKTGRSKQSVAYWCLADVEWHWTLDQVCETACELGLESVELVGPEQLPTLERYGLACALATNGMPDPPFVKGLNNLRYHEEVISRTKAAMDAYRGRAVSNVIAFTGYKWQEADNPASGEISQQDALDNCVKGLSELAQHAEQTGITVCLEHLNSRDDSHPMKGHPGYQGDNLDFCAEIIRRVGSPWVRLLFDVYHVQVMHGDVIRRLHQNRDVIGHVHTAGNPGRGPLDISQEIQYPAIVRALSEIGYNGFIGHEFIATSDPRAALEQAVALFNVMETWENVNRRPA